jgi:hypothetical protein
MESEPRKRGRGGRKKGFGLGCWRGRGDTFPPNPSSSPEKASDPVIAEARDEFRRFQAQLALPIKEPHASTPDLGISIQASFCTGRPVVWSRRSEGPTLVQAIARGLNRVTLL